MMKKYSKEIKLMHIYLPSGIPCLIAGFPAEAIRYLAILYGGNVAIRAIRVL